MKEMIIAAVILGSIVVLLLIIRQKKKYDRHIFELTYRDELTGLDNIKGFEDAIEKRRSEYIGKEVCLISMDIRHFTTINETYGREMGDLVIAYVGKKLGESLENESIIARNKGDHFLVMNTYSAEKTHALIQCIKTEIGGFHLNESGLPNCDISIGYNFGIVREEFTSDTSVKRMIDRAVMARKTAKRKNVQVLYFDDEMEQQILWEKVLEDNGEGALAEGEFTVYYQPKYNMKDNRIVGAEALIRWNSREYGFMNPDEYIPIFEKNGFVTELDFYAMEQVYKMLRRRLDEGKKVVRISMNQSRMHFKRENYIERLNELKDKYSIPDELIELELTETIFADMKEVSKIVEKLKENGYHLSVDDFGSGYSSLNMITEVPVDTLKIDKYFLNDSKEDGRYRKVIKKVVEMAEDLNMDIICEGVEKKEQADFLQSIGCLYAQGFLYARPMPESEFLQLLEST